MLELIDVTKKFKMPQGQEVIAVDRMSLRVETGETVALVGPSGCGKTTTLRLLNRLEEPDSGKLRVNKLDARQSDAVQLRRQMGYVIQSGGLFPHMTVLKNVGLLGELSGWTRDTIEKRVCDLLALVNLEPSQFLGRYPRELSGGQRQRVGVARALLLDPPYVLMDEPFGALDPVTRQQLHSEFLKLQTLLNKSIVVVTHDMQEAFTLADRVALMCRGRIVQVGTLEDFQQTPESPFVTGFLGASLAGLVARRSG